MTDIGSCRSCGHPIGYHHRGTLEEMFCSVADCDCPGYDSESIPRAGRVEAGGLEAGLRTGVPMRLDKETLWSLLVVLLVGLLVASILLAR